jgi:GINS complex subunit 4
MMDDDDDDDGWAHAAREDNDDDVDVAAPLEDEPRAYDDGGGADDDDDVFGDEARERNFDACYEPVDSEVMRLKRAWVQERLSPEMLPHEGALWASVKEAVETQEDVLERRARDRVERGGAETDASDKLLDDIMWMEVNRVKYLLREYLRTRLMKIEAHALHCAVHGETWDALSEDERRYVTGYVGAVEEHSKSVLNELPESYRDLDKENSTGEETAETSNMIPRPNLDGFAFFRIRKDVASYQPEDADCDPMNLKRGQIIMGKYSMFRSLTKTDPPTAELV